MLSTVFVEHFGLQPTYAHSMLVGGATGFAMAMLAHHLADSGAARNVLVVAGENRLTAQTRDAAVRATGASWTSGQGALGATISLRTGRLALPHEHGTSEADWPAGSADARRAITHPGAQFREP
jgi:hypothetical protein